MGDDVPENILAVPYYIVHGGAGCADHETLQYDVYGDLLGLLAAYPVAPLVSLHPLDVVRPLIPDVRSRPASPRRLFDGPVMLDSAGVMQQSICYIEANRWTVSVAWGFAVTVATGEGVVAAREMEMPARTFMNWYRRVDYKAHTFNTKPLADNLVLEARALLPGVGMAHSGARRRAREA